MTHEQPSYSDSQKLAILCAQLADDKLAENVLVIDLKKIDVAPSDFFVIAGCDSPAQAISIADLIMENAKSYRLVKPKVEGYENGEWILVDFFDVVVHIMLKDLREYYKIEKLWADGEFFTVNDDADMISVKQTDFLNN